MSSTAVWLDTVGAERSLKETLATYDTNASTYEQICESRGFSGPPTTSKFIASLGLPKDATILDAGAGTGRLGRLLKAEGYFNLHALDGSGEMLRMALKDNSYKSYTKAMLGEGHTTLFPESQFDAVVMVGVIVPGHFGMDVFPELIRITKSGGLICWGQRDPKFYADRSELFRGDNFHKAVLEVCKSNNCVLEKGPVPLPNYYKETDGFGYVLRKL